MFTAIWSARGYLLLAILTFVVFLLIYTPIHFVWRFVEPIVPKGQVALDQISGTVLHGSARISIANSDSFKTQWQLNPLSLLGGNLAANIDVDNPRLRINADVVASGIITGSITSVSLSNLDGYLNSQILLPYLRPLNADLQGEFELSDIGVTANPQNGQFSEATGRVLYSGGEVTAQLQRQRDTIKLPLMVGELSMDNETAIMMVSDESDNALGKLYMQPDGWGGVSVLKRALDATAQPWPDQAATADTVVFEVSHKIL
ncbi:MAG: type II secretion system protein N [Oleibacter sp.]|nr:type II secretion system protein N [Thalassolituus sp.]